MQVQVQIDSGHKEEELRSLHGWLRAEPALRRSVEASLLEAPAAPGAMGGLVDVLSLITGNGWSAASFVLSLVAWRQTRPRAPQVTIRRGDVEVTLASGTDEEIQRLVTMLERRDDASRQPS